MFKKKHTIVDNAYVVSLVLQAMPKAYAERLESPDVTLTLSTDLHSKDITKIANRITGFRRKYKVDGLTYSEKNSKDYTVFVANELFSEDVISALGVLAHELTHVYQCLTEDITTAHGHKLLDDWSSDPKEQEAENVREDTEEALRDVKFEKSISRCIL